MVFLDGSVYDGSVGCGARSAVLIPQSMMPLITDSKAVGKKTDSVSCELEGILLGLKLILDYFNNASCRRHRVCTFSVIVFLLLNQLSRECLFMNILNYLKD